MPAPLTSARRSELRGEAHKLKPVVMIGDNGLTEKVLAEVDRALKAHELVKVKAFSDDREARDQWLARICEALEAHPVQQIGKVFVVYRENPDKAPKPEPKPAKPAPKAKKAFKRKPEAAEREPRRPLLKKPAESITGTSRRRSRTPSPHPASGPQPRRPSTSRSGLSRSVKSRKSSRA
jgi:RNA-binding protein